MELMNQIAMAFDHAGEEKKSGRDEPRGDNMGFVLDTIGKLIAGYLQKEVPGYEPFTPSDPEHLRGIIQQGDVWLIEGNNRFAFAVFKVDRTQITDADVAVYAAHGPTGKPEGPYPGRVESLATEPAISSFQCRY